MTLLTNLPIPKQVSNQLVWNRFPILLILFSIPLGIFGSYFAPPDFAMLLAVLPIGAVIAAALTVRTEYILLLTVLLFPLENAEILNNAFPANLTLAKLLGGALLGALIFNIIFRSEHFRIFDDAHDYAVVGFCAALFFSGVISTHIDSVFNEIDRIFRLAGLYFAIKNLVRTQHTMGLIMFGLFITSVWASVVGISDYLTIITEWGNRVRAAGINENPNNFSLASVIAFSIGFHLLQTVKTRWQQGLIAAGILIILAGIILSGSRGGILSMFTVILLIIMTHPRRTELFIIASTIAIIAFPFVPESITYRLFPFLSSSDFVNTYQESVTNSNERRIGYYELGSVLVAQNPIQGNGYRSFRQLFPESEFARFDNPISESDRSRVAHSIYLETVTGTGILGLSTLLGILYMTWRGANIAGNKLDRGSVPWATARAVEFGIIGFCISSIFISSEQLKYMWFLAGMSSAVFFYAKIHTRSIRRGFFQS